MNNCAWCDTELDRDGEEDGDSKGDGERGRQIAEGMEIERYRNVQKNERKVPAQIYNWRNDALCVNRQCRPNLQRE